MSLNRKIKIAHIITRMDWGGAPDIVRILCSSLDADKFEVWLIRGKTEHPSAKTAQFLDKFRAKTIVIAQLKRDVALWGDFWAFMRLWFIMARHKFDIVHTHTAKAGFLGRIAAKLAGVKKVIHTPHGNNFYGYFGSLASKAVAFLEKFADYFTDTTIVLTELEKKELVAYGVSREEKIAVVKSGLEFDVYENISQSASALKKKELGIEDGSNIVAMIGRLEPVKGQEYFIQAAKFVLEKHLSVTFLLVGEGSLRQKLEALITELKVYGKFIFCGWREDIAEIFSITDILVLPSLNEAVGRILLEAGYLGVPVIATCVGGIPEVVKDGVTGILVPPKDSLRLADAIHILLSDKEKRVGMGKAAKEWVAANFSAQIMVKQVEQVYVGARHAVPLRRRHAVPLLMVFLIILSTTAFADELLQVPAAIQISSTISDGKHSIEGIARIAKENGAKIVIFAERDYMRWEYGLWPLRAIIKKTVTSNSLASYGIERYLKDIEKAQKENPEIILLPAVECAPFYYWEGSLFKNNLKIKNWHKHMMVMGLEGMEDYKNIPSIANKNTLRLSLYVKDFYKVWPLLGFVAGIWCLRKRKFNYKDSQGRMLGAYSLGWRVFGIAVLTASALFLLNNFPFFGYLYDSYHGDCGIMPYQNLIDYVRKKNGLIFWVHPEAEYIQTRGAIAIETKEYSQDLRKSHGYDGFTVFYDGYNKIGAPAGLWDELLQEYCRGARKRPLWAIGGLGYDQVGALDKEIKNLRTIVLLSELSQGAVIEALKKGKAYTVMGNDVLKLDDFSIQDSASDIQKTTMGDEVMLKGNPVLTIAGYVASDNDETIKITLIKNREVVRVFEAKSPFNITYEDETFTQDKKGYYRLEITSKNNILVTNPIFVSIDFRKKNRTFINAD